MSDQNYIIRLDLQGEAILDSDDLEIVAGHHGLEGLKQLLSDLPMQARRVVHSVPVEELLAREARAARTGFPPLHSLTLYWRLDVSNVIDRDELISRLEGLKNSREIDLYYFEARTGPVAPSSPPGVVQALYSYLNPAPEGVDAIYAWTRQNGKGENVRVIDLEAGWILTHEDLPKPELLFNDNDSNQHHERDHGAAVLAIIGAMHDANGIDGLAPELDSLNCVSHYEESTNSRYHVAAAIAAALGHLGAGDILLLEVARYPGTGNDGYPTEIDAVDFDAIRSAVAEGIVVIEAAANSDLNLDVNPATGIFNRESDNFIDSGAIMVGAALSAVVSDGHVRQPDSNYGNRIDCYAWGQSILTAGYGNLIGDPGGNDSYTGNFRMTSGASAIIAGVATIVQSWAKNRCVKPLSSTRMRQVLARPSTGTPQTNIAINPPDHIGAMPNLRKVLSFWLWLRILFWCLADRFWRWRLMIYTIKPTLNVEK